MKIANIVLSILILLLAAASAAFSYFLFEKRSQFVDGWGKMATAINKAAVELDKGSGRPALAGELTTSTLSHQQYATLDGKLDKLADLSRQIVNTRNSLADALRSVGRKVAMRNLPDAAAMRGVDSHVSGKNAVVSAVNTAIDNRDAMFSAFASFSRNSLGQNVSVDRMRSGDVAVLNPLKTRVSSLNSRNSAYQNALINIGRRVHAGSFNTSESGYRTSANKVVSAVNDLNNRCNQAQRALTAANNTIKRHERTIASLGKTIANYKNVVIPERDRQIFSYKRALGLSTADKGEKNWEDGSAEARSRMQGKVVEVHEKYGYIAVDLGKGTAVFQESGNLKREVNCNITKGLNLVVARGSLDGKSDFIARVVVDEVGDFCSTANIAPGAKQIKVGDIVYWTAK